MKNYKRILAAIGTAALLVSNVGAVSQVVFAEEGDIVETVPSNVVDVSQGDVSAQVQQIVDEALNINAEESETTEVAGSETATTPEETQTGSESTSTDVSTDTTTDTGSTEGAEVVPDENVDQNTDATDTTIEDEIVDGETDPDAEETDEDGELTDDDLDPDEGELDPDEELEDEVTLISPEFEAHTAVVGESGITVYASAGKNVIPEGAVLAASVITKENDAAEYNKVEEALIESDNVDYTAEDAAASDIEMASEGNDTEETEPTADFIAMDIRFEVTDAETGEVTEVEPAGDVSITFDIARDVLPTDVDPDSVTVHHLEEDAETGEVTQVVTVADTTGDPDTGKVDVQTSEDKNVAPTATADFLVDSFSSYTICWRHTKTGSDETIHFYYVGLDENGNFIRNEDGTLRDIYGKGDWYIEESDGVGGMGGMKEAIDLRYFVKDIDGFVFDTIKVKETGKDDSTLTESQFVQWGREEGEEYLWFASISGWKGDDPEFKWGNRIGSSADVYLIYRTNTYKPDEKTTPEPNVSGDKSVSNTDADDVYDLTISATSTPGTSSEPQKVDILFVLDLSSSMSSNFVYDSWNNHDDHTEHVTVSRADAAVNAINDTVTTLQQMDANKAIDARYGLVTFSTYARTDIYQQALTKDGNAVKNILSKDDFKGSLKHYYNHNLAHINCGWKNKSTGYSAFKGDTNWEAGIIAAGQALDASREDAKRIVIFLTDGIPTLCYGKGGNSTSDKSDGTVYGTGDEEKAEQIMLNRAIAAMPGMDLSAGDTFYAVGLGSGISDEFNDWVVPLARSSNFGSGSQVKAQAIPVGDSTDGLTSKLKELVADELVVDATNLVIEDPLSENVELAGDVSSSLTVKVTNANSQDVADANATAQGFQIAKNNGSGEYWTLTPSTYTDENGVTYVKLTFPDDYTLETGWTYQLVAKVKPTAAAYKTYRDNKLYDSSNAYPDMEIVDGTVTENKGLFTNNKTYTNSEGGTSEAVAQITYQYKDASGSNTSGSFVYDDKPVIQINPGYLTITKTINGLNSDSIGAAKANTAFAVEVKVGNATVASQTIRLDGKVLDSSTNTWVDSSEVAVTEASGKYTITSNLLKGLDTNATYTVTEQKVDSATSKPGEVVNYTVTNDAQLTKTGTVAWNMESKAEYTNTYKSKIVDTAVTVDNNMFPALVATIDVMAVMFVVYGMAKRRVR